MRTRTVLAAMAAALVLALAPAARADDAPSAASTTATPATKTAVVVKIDIVETIDGAESPENLTAFFVRKKLREAGFTAYSTRHIHADDVIGGGKPAAAEAHPDPDLTITGKVTIKPGKKSTFYGTEVAFSFDASAALSVLDKAGKVADTLKHDDEWGDRVEKEARRETLRRIALFSAVRVMESEAVRAKMENDKTRASTHEWAEGMEKKLKAEGGAGK